MNPIITYYLNGKQCTVSYVDSERRLHRIGGPAYYIMRKNGTIKFVAWYIHGIPHNKHGPSRQSQSKNGVITSVAYHWYGVQHNVLADGRIYPNTKLNKNTGAVVKNFKYAGHFHNWLGAANDTDYYIHGKHVTQEAHEKIKNELYTHKYIWALPRAIRNEIIDNLEISRSNSIFRTFTPTGLRVYGVVDEDNLPHNMFIDPHYARPAMVILHPDGTIKEQRCYYHGFLMAEDYPAVVCFNERGEINSQYYYYYGSLHTTKNSCIVKSPNGEITYSRYWFGHRHNTAGPSVYKSHNGERSAEYYICGKQYTESEYKKIFTNDEVLAAFFAILPQPIAEELSEYYYFDPFE